MATDKERIADIQRILGVDADGIVGPITRKAFDDLAASKSSTWNYVNATSFADPRDVEAFRKCKAEGRTDEDCFSVGDNGIGCYGDDMTGEQAYCALPPEKSEEKWGSVSAAKHKPVEVRIGNKSATVLLGDRMPREANIRNNAGIDLNPAACSALGVQPPLFTDAQWRWA